MKLSGEIYNAMAEPRRPQFIPYDAGQVLTYKYLHAAEGSEKPQLFWFLTVWKYLLKQGVLGVAFSSFIASWVFLELNFLMY